MEKVDLKIFTSKLIRFLSEKYSDREITLDFILGYVDGWNDYLNEVDNLNKSSFTMDRIKVGSLFYEVIESEYFKSHDYDRNLWGYCDYEKLEIFIRSSLSEQKKKQVLAHELTHAIFHSAGYTEQDEDMVNRVSIVLHQVLQENDVNEMFSCD